MASNLLYLIIGLFIGWYLNQLLNLLAGIKKQLTYIYIRISEKTGLNELLKKVEIKDKLYIKKDTNLEDVGL